MGQARALCYNNFFSLIFFFYSRDRPNRKGETARTCSLMNSLPRQLFIPSSSPRAISRPISLLPSIICLAQIYEYYKKKKTFFSTLAKETHLQMHEA